MALSMEKILEALEEDMNAFHGTPVGHGENEELDDNEPKYNTEEERLLHKVLKAQSLLLKEVHELRIEVDEIKSNLDDE